MVALSVYFHERFLDHDTGAWHPEAPDRLVAARRALASAAVPFEWREPSPAATAQIARVHTSEYIQDVERMAGRGGGALDMDTQVSEASYEAALLAAGAGVEAVERAVSAGERSFLLVRPPGHHAVRSRGMGFCLFNNIAVAAAHARAELGVERVLISDWDVHHGNGTQDAFYQDPAVLYASIHLRNHYPGTGATYEVGDGPGKGFTVNVPLRHGVGDGVVRYLFETVLEPVARAFRPGLVLILAGMTLSRRSARRTAPVGRRLPLDGAPALAGGWGGGGSGSRLLPRGRVRAGLARRLSCADARRTGRARGELHP